MKPGYPMKLNISAGALMAVTANTFTIDYSTDNGAKLDGDQQQCSSSTSRNHTWTVPATTFPMRWYALPVLTTSHSGPECISTSILECPLLGFSAACPGYAQLNWGAVTGATSYDIMMMKGDTSWHITIPPVQITCRRD